SVRLGRHRGTSHLIAMSDALRSGLLLLFVVGCTRTKNLGAYPADANGAGGHGSNDASMPQDGPLAPDAAAIGSNDATADALDGRSNESPDLAVDRAQTDGA